MRLADRYKDARLTGVVGSIQQRAQDDDPTLHTVKAAGRRLIDMANATDCQALIDACVTECERLNAMRADEPAYAAEPLPAHIASGSG